MAEEFKEELIDEPQIDCRKDLNNEMWVTAENIELHKKNCKHG